MAVVEADATHSLRVRYGKLRNSADVGNSVRAHRGRTTLAGQGGAASPVIQSASTNAKLALMEGRKTRIADLKREAQELLAGYRKDPKKLQAADLLALMENTGAHRGSGMTTTPNIRGE